MSNERKLTLAESMHIYGRIVPERTDTSNTGDRIRDRRRDPGSDAEGPSVPAWVAPIRLRVTCSRCWLEVVYDVLVTTVVAQVLANEGWTLPGPDGQLCPACSL